MSSYLGQLETLTFRILNQTLKASYLMAAAIRGTPLTPDQEPNGTHLPMAPSSRVIAAEDVAVQTLFTVCVQIQEMQVLRGAEVTGVLTRRLPPLASDDGCQTVLTLMSATPPSGRMSPCDTRWFTRAHCRRASKAHSYFGVNILHRRIQALVAGLSHPLQTGPSGRSYTAGKVTSLI